MSDLASFLFQIFTVSLQRLEFSLTLFIILIFYYLSTRGV